MTTDDKHFGKQIKHLLDRSAGGLDARVQGRLAAARATALARIGQARTEPVLAGAGGGSVGGSRPLFAQARFWIGVAIIAAAGFGWQQWQAFQQVREAEEIDTLILTSDLPIDAYLDRGFQVWLKTGAER